MGYGFRPSTLQHIAYSRLCQHVGLYVWMHDYCIARPSLTTGLFGIQLSDEIFIASLDRLPGRIRQDCLKFWKVTFVGHCEPRVSSESSKIWLNT